MLTFVIVVFLLLLVAGCLLLLRSAPRQITPGAWSTSLPLLLLKVLLRSLVRPQGVLPDEWTAEDDSVTDRTISVSQSVLQKRWT